MAHRTGTSGYRLLTERINKFPQGAPSSDLLYRIFALLFTEHEAALMAQLPLRPFTAATAARAWQLPLPDTERILDDFSARALLLDGELDGRKLYVFPPPMAGFFEFSLMRVRPDVEQQALADLLYRYINVEDDFVTALFGAGETQIGRALVHRPALAEAEAADEIVVLGHERADEVIRAATHRGVSACYCRHKMHHVGKACSAPLEICMSLDFAADSLVRHGHARAIDEAEALDLLAQAEEAYLLQFAENVRLSPKFLCHCCSCCCEALVAARRTGFLHPIHTTNFLAETLGERCRACGRCAEVCPVGAIELKEAPLGNDASGPRAVVRRAVIAEEDCLGCGICTRACAYGALELRARGERVITPVNSAQRVVIQAIETDTLPYLVFHEQGLASHRALAAVLGVIVKLPPFKQALASRQLKSRYLERICDRSRWRY